MIRTNKTILCGIAAALLALSAVCFAEDTTPADSTFTTGLMVDSYDPATYTGDTGTVSLPCACEAIFTLMKFNDGKQGGLLQARGNKDTLKIPVGTFKLVYCSVTLPTKNGVTFSVVVEGNPNDKSGTIVISKDQQTKLPALDKAVSNALSTKTGTITLPYNAPAMVALTGVKQKVMSWYFNISSESKTVTVPAGKYGFLQCDSSVTGKDGVKWAITSRAASLDDLPTIEVKPNADLKLGPFEPIVASVETNKDAKGNTILSMQMTGKDGNLCMIRNTENVESKHGFKVLSKAGAVLMSGKFEFG